MKIKKSHVALFTLVSLLSLSDFFHTSGNQIITEKTTTEWIHSRKNITFNLLNPFEYKTFDTFKTAFSYQQIGITFEWLVINQNDKLHTKYISQNNVANRFKQKKIHILLNEITFQTVNSSHCI